MVIHGHNLGNSQVRVNRTIGPTLVYYCTTADVLTTHLQQCFLFFIVGNSQVSVYRTIGPTLDFSLPEPKDHR